MNTFLNLQQEFKCNRQEMDRQIEHLLETPLITRIYQRGSKEQANVTFRINYYPDHRRQTKETRNNWRRIFYGNIK